MGRCVGRKERHWRAEPSPQAGRLGKPGQYNVPARGERPRMSKAAEGERAEDQAMTIGFTHGEVPRAAWWHLWPKPN